MTSPAPTRQARARLDRLMDGRRAELRMRWKDVAELAGLSTEGLRNLRSGTGEIRALSKRGIEDALQWTSGSIDAILDGGDPTPRTPARSAMDRAEEMMDENERLAQLVVERFRRLSRKKRNAVVHLLDALEDDPPGDAENR